MNISRRDFLRFCTASSATLALSSLDIFNLERALANPNAPSVLWLQGSGCTGCSVSLMNRISPAPPTTAGDLLIRSINLAYHPNLMAVAGDSAVAVARQIAGAGNYVLAVEGGIPTKYGGAACWAWTENGRDVTFLEAAQSLATPAAAVLSIGTCACWGGMSAAYPNPTGVVGLSAATQVSTINIPGCPPHPDWIVGTIAKLLAGSVPTLDEFGRPLDIYAKAVHDKCPRKGTTPATTYGMDGRCLKDIGCFGPKTKANCQHIRWNGGVNWCVDSNSQCIGCTDPKFPASPLRRI